MLLLESFRQAQARRQQFLPAMLQTHQPQHRKKSVSKEERLAHWDKQVRAFLEKQYPNAPLYKSSLLNLWETYLSLELPNSHFVVEFTSSRKEAVFQRTWEMMLACHLDAQGHRLTTSDEGPDFRFEHAGQTVWVEATSPEPKGLPADWMEGPKPNGFKVGEVPHKQILLRWTAAIKAKWETGQNYRHKGIIGENDAYVIAINGGQLGVFPLQHGVSHFPYAIEAVYAAGPVGIPVDKETGRFGKPFVSIRASIKTEKGASVPTALFVDPKYSDVSAIIACSITRPGKASLPVDVIHNHFARVRVPERILGSNGEEWVTKAIGSNEIELYRLATEQKP